MSLTKSKNFDKILDYAHFWNWAPDWQVVKDIYTRIPESYSVLTPFAYTYLEELIRTTTSEYGESFFDRNGQPIKIKVGMALISLAIKENQANTEYIALLEDTKKYFDKLVNQERTDWGIYTTNTDNPNILKGKIKDLEEAMDYEFEIVPTYQHLLSGGSKIDFPTQSTIDVASGNGFNGKNGSKSYGVILVSISKGFFSAEIAPPAIISS